MSLAFLSYDSVGNIRYWDGGIGLCCMDLMFSGILVLMISIILNP